MSWTLIGTYSGSSTGSGIDLDVTLTDVQAGDLVILAAYTDAASFSFQATFTAPAPVGGADPDAPNGAIGSSNGFGPGADRVFIYWRQHYAGESNVYRMSWGAGVFATGGLMATVFRNVDAVPVHGEADYNEGNTGTTLPSPLLASNPPTASDGLGLQGLTRTGGGLLSSSPGTIVSESSAGRSWISEVASGSGVMAEDDWVLVGTSGRWVAWSAWIMTAAPETAPSEPGPLGIEPGELICLTPGEVPTPFTYGDDESPYGEIDQSWAATVDIENNAVFVVSRIESCGG